MRRKSALIALFFIVYLLFTVAMVPANKVLSWVTLPANVQIGEVSGTIWRSKVSAIKVDKLLINQVSAKLSFLSLLTADPSIHIEFGDALVAGPEGKATVSGLFSSISLTDIEVNMPAALVTEQLNLPIPLVAHDYFDIQIDEFLAGAPICSQLNGKIVWSKAAITALEQRVKLGALKVALSCQQGDVVMVLDEDNELGLSFTASVGGNGIVSGDGYLVLKNNTPEAIKQILPFLGNPDNQGRYRLRF